MLHVKRKIFSKYKSKIQNMRVHQRYRQTAKHGDIWIIQNYIFQRVISAKQTVCKAH